MKVIKHAHDGTIVRLPNVDAHLLVSSGRYVYSSKFEARKAGMSSPRKELRLLARIGMIVAALAMIAAALLFSTAARAADKPVPKQPVQSTQPYKVCLTQQQARQVYKGQHLKYREVQGERCWFAGKTLPKSAFIPRSTSVASKPSRTIQQDTQRARDSAGAVPASRTITYTGDAYQALTGMPEKYFTFDQYWNLMTGWAR